MLSFVRLSLVIVSLHSDRLVTKTMVLEFNLANLTELRYV